MSKKKPVKSISAKAHERLRKERAARGPVEKPEGNPWTPGTAAYNMWEEAERIKKQKKNAITVSSPLVS